MESVSDGGLLWAGSCSHQAGRAQEGRPQRFSPVPLAAAPVPLSSRSLSIELLVEEEDEQVDVDLSSVEQLHNCNAFVLQLQQVLVM